MAWWDTLISGANTLGNLYNAAKPLINTGAAIYDRNQTRGAISDAFNQYKGYADRSLNTLGQVYNQGVQATQPYRQAGTSALSGYQNLLSDPSSITNNPAYQFRVNQGQQAITRNAAANRMLGSGNFATALQDYGQQAATQEYDNALSRYLPLMQGGLQSTGQMMDAGRNYAYGVGQINEALGNAAGGARIGQAGATSDMLGDILGLGGGSNPFSAIGDLSSQVGNIFSGGSSAGQLANAGGGTAGGALEAAKLTASETAGGTGSWADLSAGPNKVNSLSSFYGANAAVPALAGIGGSGLAGLGTTAGTAGALGSGGFASGIGSSVGAGTATSLPGMGGTTAAWNSMTSGIGSGTAAATTGGGVTGTLTAAAPYMAAIGLGIGALKALSNLSGGASDRNKPNEVMDWFKKSPDAGYQNLDKIITNKKWSDEVSNIGVIGDMADRGVINASYPSLNSADSVLDVWNMSVGGSPTMSARWGKYGDMSAVSPKLVAQTYGMNEAQQNQYADLVNSLKTSQEYWSDPDAGRGIAARRAPPRPEQIQSQLDQMRSQYMTEDRKRATAQSTYQTLRNNGYTGDLSKLERYLGIA